MTTSTPPKLPRLRWRLGGGSSGAWQTLTLPDADKYNEAKNLVAAHRKNISKIEVFAVVMGVEVEDPVTEIEPAGKPLSEYIEPYIQSMHDCEVNWKQRTRAYLLDKFIARVGDKPVLSIAQEDVDNVLTWLRSCDCVGGKPGFVCGAARKDTSKPHSDGFGKRTVDRHFAVFKGFFNYLVSSDAIPSSPLANVKYRPQSLSKYNSDAAKEDAHFYMSKHQYQILRRSMEPDYRLFLDFLVETGARFSEGAALPVSALLNHQDKTPEVAIKWAWKAGDGEPYLGKPKGGGIRNVTVRRELMNRLVRACAGKSPEALVFTSPEGKKLDNTNFRRRQWGPAVIQAMRCDIHPPVNRGRRVGAEELQGPRCRDNGGTNTSGKPCGSYVQKGWNLCKDHLVVQPEDVSSCDCSDERLMRAPRPHDLRHTHAAQLIAAGVRLVVISRRLGHASVQITEAVYAGKLPHLDDEAAAASSMELV